MAKYVKGAVLYYSLFSAPCRTVLQTIKALDVDFSASGMIKLDIHGKRDHLEPWFAEINPEKTVPTLVDNGFALWESRAIAKFLVLRYASPRKRNLYPSNITHQAMVDRMLYFDVAKLARTIGGYFDPQVVRREIPDPLLGAEVEKSLQLLDDILKADCYALGSVGGPNHLTIADFSLLATLSWLESMDYRGLIFPDDEMTLQWYVKDIKTQEETALLEKQTIVGRNRNATIVSVSKIVSKHHAKFYLMDGGLFVEDLNSSNGTFVNNMKIAPFKHHSLKVGDIVGMGTCQNELPVIQHLNDYLILEVKKQTVETYKLNLPLRNNEVYSLSSDESDKQCEDVQAIPTEGEKNILSETLSKTNRSNLNEMIPGISTVENKLIVEKIEAKTSKLNEGDETIHSDFIVPLKQEAKTDSGDNWFQKEGKKAVGKVPASKSEEASNSSKRKLTEENRIADDPTSAFDIKCTGKKGKKIRPPSETDVIGNTVMAGSSAIVSEVISKEIKAELKDLKQHSKAGSDIVARCCEKVTSTLANNEHGVGKLINDSIGASGKKIQCDVQVKIECSFVDSPSGAAAYTIEDDYIIIDDDEDDGVACSQHFKVEDAAIKEEAPDDSLKQELEKMDFVDGDVNPVVVYSDDEGLESAADLLGVLQCTPEETKAKRRGGEAGKSDADRGECSKKWQKPKYVRPPIIEAPAITPRARKFVKRLMKVNEGTAPPTKKSKTSGASAAAIADDRKKKLKEIAAKGKTFPETKPKVGKVKVKTSDGRGNFLLEKVLAPSSAPPAVPATATATATAAKTKPPTKSVNADASWVVSCILKWSVTWIKEQEQKPFAPPLLDHPLERMRLNFRSHGDYSRIVTALLMHEVWYCVFKESTESKGKFIFKATVMGQQKVNDLVHLLCSYYITEEENSHLKHVKESDLILVEFRSSKEGKTMLRTLFGYVFEFRKTRINQTDDVTDASFANSSTMKSSQPGYRVEFVVATKMQEESVISSVLNFKFLTSLTTAMRLFKSIENLKKSPLCWLVLKPEMKDFKMPKVSISTLVSGDLLNPTQLQVVMEATQMCLGRKPGISMIQGPPGTGKTTVITNIAQQVLFGQGAQANACILLTAPSNAAVDELALRFIKRVKPNLNKQRKRLKLIRVGPKESVAKEVQNYFLDNMVKYNMKTDIMQANPDAHERYKLLEKRIEELEVEIAKVNARKGNWRSLEAQLKAEKSNLDNFTRSFLSDKYFSVYKETEMKLIKCANVMCTTLSSCAGRTMQLFERANMKFTCCIIDEVTQSSEAETLIPLMLDISKLVLVGDPQQLPAAVFSKEAKQQGYEKSLFARIKDNFSNKPDSPVRILSNQYRMHPEICSFANRTYYNGVLNSAAFTSPNFMTLIKPYLVFNIESAENANQKYQNDMEIEFVIKLLTALFQILGSKVGYSVGIVTPYNNQKNAIGAKLKSLRINSNISVNVNTVDSFQGQEKDIMIMSCVRYTPNTFLSNDQRVNVAITRAKYAFYIVGTQCLFENCSVLSKLRDDAKQRELLREVQDVSAFDVQKVIFNGH